MGIYLNNGKNNKGSSLNIKISPDEPTTGKDKDLWVDDSSAPFGLNIYKDSKWNPIGSTSVDGGSGDSLDISYINSSFPDVDNVKDALDKLLYTPPSITTFNINPSVVEKGSTVNDIALTWSVNKNVLTQEIDQSVGQLDKDIRSFNLSATNITTDKTFKLTVTDEKQPTTRTTSIVFRQKRIWGVSDKDKLTSAELLSLLNEFSTSRQQSKVFNPINQYIYFAFPSSFGNPSFKVNGLANNAWIKETISHRNSSGHIENYDVYRSQFPQNGSNITVEIT